MNAKKMTMTAYAYENVEEACSCCGHPRRLPDVVRSDAWCGFVARMKRYALAFTGRTRPPWCVWCLDRLRAGAVSEAA